MTLCEALVEAIRKAGETNTHAEQPPVAVLWPDGDRQWEPLLPRLRAALPLLTYGAYDPAAKTGPAIWLRCLVARTLPEADWPADEIPILYLPGVSYQQLRQPADLPDAVKPLAELQYRGTVWCHRRDRDWTVASFLRSDRGGLELDVANDAATQQALQRALTRLADEPVERLARHGTLGAAFFNELLQPDRARAVLLWLNDPPGQRKSLSTEAWQALCESCRTDLGFNPETDGEITGALRLGKREGAWEPIWQRFTEAPGDYPHLPHRLRQARPAKSLELSFEFDEQPSSWPQDNDDAEDVLRTALRGLLGQDRVAIKAALRKLERDHGERREWVWAKLGRAPLARALVPLLALAEGARQPLSGEDVAAIVQRYAAEGWRVDAALIRCLDAVDGVENTKAVWGVADSLYRPWLAESASNFQAAVDQRPDALPMAPLTGEVAPEGGCLLFCDGLRMDLAQQLAEQLRARGCEVAVEHRLAAFPTVTATAKPAVSPVAAKLGPGTDLGVCGPGGGALTADGLRKLLAAEGYTVLAADECGAGQGRGWTEAGRIDHLGHSEGERLPRRLESELAALLERVEALLAAGWRQVRLVTDHGWLLVPYSLPKEELPEHLTQLRKGRCARLNPGGSFGGLTMPWSWDPAVRIAVATGIACFQGNECYEHGGLSPQECVTPRVIVSRTAAATLVSIESVFWRGLRCQVQVAGGAGLQVDVRTKPADAASSVVLGEQKRLDGGKASVPCNDAAQGRSVTVVVLTEDGAVVAQQHTLVPEG